MMAGQVMWFTVLVRIVVRWVAGEPVGELRHLGETGQDVVVLRFDHWLTVHFIQLVD